MIEVFEKWFDQFSKPEQEKLLKHIRKNHFDFSEPPSPKPSGKNGKKLLNEKNDFIKIGEAKTSRR